MAGSPPTPFAAASPSLSDDAAVRLFVAGLAARLTRAPDGGQALWSLTRFEPYAPGLEQAALPANMLLFAQAKDDAEVLAVPEDDLREGALAGVVAEVKRASICSAGQHGQRKHGVIAIDRERVRRTPAQ